MHAVKKEGRKEKKGNNEGSLVGVSKVEEVQTHTFVTDSCMGGVTAPRVTHGDGNHIVVHRSSMTYDSRVVLSLPSFNPASFSPDKVLSQPPEPVQHPVVKCTLLTGFFQPCTHIVFSSLPLHCCYL